MLPKALSPHSLTIIQYMPSGAAVSKEREGNLYCDSKMRSKLLFKVQYLLRLILSLGYISWATVQKCSEFWFYNLMTIWMQDILEQYVTD